MGLTSMKMSFSSIAEVAKHRIKWMVSANGMRRRRYIIDRLGKTAKNLSHNNSCPDQESNQIPPEFKYTASPLNQLACFKSEQEF
jgi:hypothetical protein